MMIAKETYQCVRAMCEEDGVTFERAKALLATGFSVEEVTKALGISPLRVKIYQVVIDNYCI